MDINYDTDRLIIINYPKGAGGKLISLCLALDLAVVHQDERLARAKIAGRMNEDYSFKVSKSVITKSKTWHFELGCKQLAGFDTFHKEEQARLANDLWKELTNQSSFYFPMMTHSGGKWTHYPNSQHIILKNYEWITEARQMYYVKKINEEFIKKENILYFDQSSIKDRTAFKNEIKKLFEYFVLDEPNWDRIEELRSSWLDTFRIGF
jgi:hypothetical protein